MQKLPWLPRSSAWNTAWPSSARRGGSSSPTTTAPSAIPPRNWNGALKSGERRARESRPGLYYGGDYDELTPRSYECRLAAELLLDRFGVVVSAAASTFSSSPLNAGRPSTTLFGSSTFLDDDDTASDYLPTPLTTTSRVFSSLGGPSHADRLADFRRSLTATAHARGISEQEVLRQLEEEEGLDPLQSPEVEFDRMLLTPTRAGRKRKRREEARVVTRGLDDDEEDQKPDFASSSSASITTRSLPGWKPPRAERGDAPFPQSRMTTKKEQLSSPRLPPPPIDSGDDDDDDDELMRALDTVLAEGSGSGQRRFRPPPAGYLPSQPASDQPLEEKHLDKEKELE